ncbi:phosphotransferase [Kribbella sp. NPDC048915]|uniref:phosphotransferase enzyme family protein n=1 Tax=Kribbella sp. NPDC048915 TaxID=3155148 RepID=UPI0033D8AEDE
MAVVDEVLRVLGVDVVRWEPTRAGDEVSAANGNWHVWTSDGRYVLRRYHVLKTPASLDYEARVLAHVASRGWCVPAPLTAPVEFGGRLWAVTRFVPGQPHQQETCAHQRERGVLLARLHADLRELELGERPGFWPAADLGAMGEFQDWDRGVERLGVRRPGLADRCARAMGAAQELVRREGLLELPRLIVHGDFAAWNLHFDDAGRLAGVIDFDLCHPDSRAWELVIARAKPELIKGYQSAATHPLTDQELAAIGPLQVVYRVLMVMAELWSGQQGGRFDAGAITRHLSAVEGRS